MTSIKLKVFAAVLIIACCSITSCTIEIDLMPKVVKCATDHYPEDTAQICSTYNMMKDKEWFVDSIVVNGVDVTQQVLDDLGGYYKFGISANTYSMNGSRKDSMADAYIRTGNGWYLSCAWLYIKGFTSDFPLSINDKPPVTMPLNAYIAPLPLYFRGVNALVAYDDSALPPKTQYAAFKILQLKSDLMRCRLITSDTTCDVTFVTK
jgi:hypothetical protein